MRERCERVHHHNYERYGGRGIRVCQEWREWPAFRDWANANGYHADLQIDRIDNDGHYSPINCRWVTAAKNIRNSTAAKLTEFKAAYIRSRAVKYAVADLADLFGVTRKTIRNVLNGHTWKGV
jgi:hypothetical protein